MTRKIFIYSGEIKSGKTTNLFRWFVNQQNVSGILQPVIEDKRYFYSIVDKELIQLEISREQAAKLNEEEIEKIGNYIFLKNGFEKAKDILYRDFVSNYNWLIIDEIGPLELNNSGLEPIVTKIINERNNFNGNILCVVRDKLFKQFIEFYKIYNEFEIFDRSFLNPK